MQTRSSTAKGHAISKDGVLIRTLWWALSCVTRQIATTGLWTWRYVTTSTILDIFPYFTKRGSVFNSVYNWANLVHDRRCETSHHLRHHAYYLYCKGIKQFGTCAGWIVGVQYAPVRFCCGTRIGFWVSWRANIWALEARCWPFNDFQYWWLWSLELFN